MAKAKRCTEKGQRLSRPNPMNYDFYYHVDDSEYDADDWDEEVYYEDLQKWMDLKAQVPEKCSHCQNNGYRCKED